MITVKNLSVSAGKTPILKNISYTFEPDSVYVIMGPNGSGKSTLAYALMGHPGYTLGKKSSIQLNGTDLTDVPANERAQAGLFLSFQTPLTLSGVTVEQLMQLALKGLKDPLTIRKELTAYAKKLKVPEPLLHRSLNDGASGGEKKKLEVLQAAVLNRSVQIYDEVDTGVDVDALRTIASFLHAQKKGKTYIIITHYNRIVRALKPDHVLVLSEGAIAAEGDHTLASRIEEDGYAAVITP